MIEFFKWLGNVLLRMVFGAIGIFAINAILQAVSKSTMVGMNAETLLTVGLLGVPGFVMLYAVAFCVNGA
ncbi:MAG: pro-sigmaK processing inhibitor BofA family protein [Velocimicrobium sp.]